MSTPAGFKPHLSIARILQMNLGFLGLQFSFGLQQGNMTAIYSFLGADPHEIPYLSIAGPLTGLIVQPIIGAMSDRTLSRYGRRTPYFLIGAIICSLGLFFMPMSSSLLMAVSLLLLLDVGNNITMEPYRAYVSDRLDEPQHRAGFLSQSAFTGLAQMLALLTPSLLVWFGMSRDWVDGHNIPYTVRSAFFIGAFLSIATILYSMWRVPELPLSEDQRAWIAKQPRGVLSIFTEIFSAIREMPMAMRKLAVMSLFQWYGMSIYWGFAILSIARSVYDTTDAKSPAFLEAQLTNGQVGAFYNACALVAAIAMVPLSRRFGAGIMHAVALCLGGLSMILFPQITDKAGLFFVVIGIGIAWGSIMGNPYVILAGSIPPERTGVYMGVFNMMICAPMLINAATLPFIMKYLFHEDARLAMALGGVMLILAGISVLWVKEGWRKGAGVASAT